MTKEEFISNWLYNLDDKEDAMKMMADLDKVINSQFEKSDEKKRRFKDYCVLCYCRCRRVKALFR